MKLNLDFTGITLLKDWWKTVKENFEVIQSHSTEEVIDHPDKSVTTAKIADYAVKSTQLGENSVSASKIAGGAVRTTHLKDGNVTRAKLSSEVQTQLNNFQAHINNPSQEIADNAVTKDKFAIDERSDYERSVSTVGFINTLYGCRAFLWTKSEMVLPNQNFPSEFDLYDTKQVVDEDFEEDVWYLYKHDGTFAVTSFTYIINNTSIYYGLKPVISGKGMYALKFHTTTPAQGTFIASGTCEVIKIAEGVFEDMISGGSTSITVDSELSSTSENPVQNKVVKAEIDAINEKFGTEGGENFLKYISDCGSCFDFNKEFYSPVFRTDFNGIGGESINEVLKDLVSRVEALEG